MVDVKIWLWNGEPCWHVLFAKKARPNHMLFFFFRGDEVICQRESYVWRLRAMRFISQAVM